MPINFKNGAFSSANLLLKSRIDLSAWDIGKTDDPPKPSFDLGIPFDLDIPFEQLSVFTRHIDTASPITKLPIFAIAGFALTAPSLNLLNQINIEKRPVFPRIPLGVIGTDHVGYGSFDLWSLRHVQVVQSIEKVLKSAELIGPNTPRLTVELSELLLMPFKDPAIAFNALREGDRGPNFICVRMDLDDAMLAGRTDWPPMPAMQTPGILDWRLSPGSFSMAGALLIGEDGCETFLPSNLSTRLVRFRQVLRTDKIFGAERDKRALPRPIGFNGAMYLGYTIQFNTEWFPLGHSLGQIAYSMPLAPGEKINIAVVDWSRKDVAKRVEQTTEKEDLTHATVRDRSLTEAIQMVVRESQSGSSSMTGGAIDLGAGIPIGPISLGVGASLAFGNAGANSEGMRSVVGNTTQQISDGFHQASSALRELNSTVIVQGEQAEAAQARTRVVANYNHSHALTIFYYEVLQHHRVLTRPVAVKPVLFLKHYPLEFDYSNIERYHTLIAKNLLDESLRECLSIVLKRTCLEINYNREKQRREALGNPSDDYELGDFSFWVLSGPIGPTMDISIKVITKAGGNPIDCVFADPSIHATRSSWPPNPKILGNWQLTPPRIRANEEFLTVCRPTQKIRWANVAAIEIKQTYYGDGTTENNFGSTLPNDWNIQKMRFITQQGADKWVMFDGAPAPQNVRFDGSTRANVVEFKTPLTSVDDLLTDQERCCLKRLIKHLNANKHHYWRAIWLAEDSADRAERLNDFKLNDIRLSNIIENNLLDVVDQYVVMPIANGAEKTIGKILGIKDLGHEKLPFDEFVEQILTLPARGVFAEAKLGHCNASEVIDPTRFWDWQTSPIPDQAPMIAPASTDSRNQSQTEALKATPFPTSLVNIVNPQALPDPTGLGAASNVMSALGQFRDMSGIKDLAPFLQTLSNNAAQLASQGMKNSQIAGLMNVLRSAKEIPDEKRADLISELLTGQVKANTTPVPPSNASSPVNGTAPSPTTQPPSSSGAQLMSNPESGLKPKPISPPIPKRSPSLSPKTHLLVFVFAFDINDVMFGRWTVTLLSGGQVKKENRMINTVSEVSGVDIGNRMEMHIEESFGGNDDITVQISGIIVGLPEALAAGKRSYNINSWSEYRNFGTVIKRDDFVKAHTIRVVQETEPMNFKIVRSVQDTKAETKVTEQTGNIEVGVENTMEVGGTVGIAEGKDAVKINAKGSYGIKSGLQNIVQGTNGYTEEVSFSGRKIKDSAPTIEPLV